MSSQKIIKCHESVHESLWKNPLKVLFPKATDIGPYIKTYPCALDEEPEDYSFKGQVLKDRLNGTGKLKIGSM